MKKVFKISLVSVLMSMSMLAGAMAYDYTPLISARPNSYEYITADGGSQSSNADGLELGEWKATWNSYGTAKGTTMCSADWDGYSRGNTISSTPASITDPEATAGCWCKLTGFTDNNEITYNDTSLWVFNRTFNLAFQCESNCAYVCGNYVRNYSAMRSGLFGSVSQGSGAGADEPTAGDANSPTATNAPKYGLMGAGTNDGSGVSAGYVKGSYNAVIKGINKTHDEIGTLNTNIGTYANAVSNLTNGKATQTGTVKTIKAATTSETIASSSVNITSVTPTSISATASGTVNLSAPIMVDWMGDAAAANPIQATATFSGLPVNNIAMSAPSANTATLTKSGIGGTVNVAEYIAQAAAAAAHYSGYQTLISTGPNSFGYKSADGSDSENADGLANGEWKATWNSYGTAKGISMCSVTGEDGSISMGATGDPSSTAGVGCWCKLTGFTDNDNTTYKDTSLWVFCITSYSASGCASNCAFVCGYSVRDNSAMRSGVLGSVQQ